MKTIHRPAEKDHMETMETSGLLSEIESKNYPAVMQELNIRIRKYGEEEIVFLEGEEVGELAVLHEGTLRGEKFHMEGNVDLMYMYKRGEIFGAEATVSRLKTSPLTYIANEEITVIFIGFSEILKSKFAEKITLALLRILADDNIKKLYKIEALSKRGLRERILTYLRIMSQKAGNGTFSIHMDRAQFAQYLCVNRSALSYELNQMKREGLIDFHKDRFKLLEKID